MQFTITFLPDNKKINAKRGDNLLKTAIANDIFINSPCGGTGKCGKCKVNLSGHFSYSENAIKDDYILACQTTINGDGEVFIPEISTQKKLQILTKSEIKLKKLNPMVKKLYLELEKPSLNDNISDLERIERALRNIGIEKIDISLELLRGLSELLRESDFKITLTIVEY